MNTTKINSVSMRLSDHKYHFLYIKESETDIKNICAPMLDTFALKRLKNAQFLGILSSKFNLYKTRLFRYSKSDLHATTFDDESRYEHSIGVAYLAFSLSKILKFSEKNSLYAACWGLLHDIASWPLSHTGEAAFSYTTKVKPCDLRQYIISGSRKLPERYSVKRTLYNMGLSHDVLLLLFEKQMPSSLDDQLKIFWQIVHSPLTPDTIEGVWRATKHFGIRDVPRPDDLINCYHLDLFNMPLLYKDKINLIVKFWKKKAELYDTFINNEEMVKWESACSLIIINNFNKLSLIDSLEIEESKLLEKIKTWLHGIDHTIRYKHPLKYICDSKSIKKIRKDPPIKYLNDFLKKAWV